MLRHRCRFLRLTPGGLSLLALVLLLLSACGMPATSQQLAGRWQLVEVSDRGITQSINTTFTNILLHFVDDHQITLLMTRNLGYKVDAIEEHGTYTITGNHIQFDVLSGSRTLMELFGVEVVVLGPANTGVQQPKAQTLTTATCALQVENNRLTCAPDGGFTLNFQKQSQ